MPTRLVVSIVSALVAVFFWRNGRVLKNVLEPSELPAAYFAGGDAQSRCNVIKDTVSQQLKYCEDAIFWDTVDKRGVRNRRLLVSCDPFRKQWNTVMGPLRDPNPRGALWIYTPSSKSPLTNVELENYPYQSDFHPLGVDIFPGSSAEEPSHLLVVNHGRHYSTIEQFQLSPVAPYRASYIRTLTSPHFVAPNGIAFTSPSSFYVTQDHRFTRRLPGLLGKLLPMIETILLPGLAWVNYVDIHADGNLNVIYAARGVAFPNGIAVSGNGTKVAVASSSQGNIQLYSRKDDNMLDFKEVVQLPFSPDNLAFEDDGKLIVAGHPDFLALSAVAAQKKQEAPSWIVSVVPRVESFDVTVARQEDFGAPYPVSNRAPISSSYEVKTLYQSNGSAFSSSTTGLWDERSRTLFAIGLYQEGILTCRGEI